MKVKNNNVGTFLSLLRAGLFPKKEVQEFNVDSVWPNLQEFKDIEWGEVYRLAEEQSVVGLVAAGIEELRTKSCSAVDVPQEWALQFIGQTLQIEQRNKAMNEFFFNLIKKLRNAGVYTLLVKGQGIAQCYERPHWRASGDVDLFLSDENYRKAVALLSALASSIDEDRPETKHLAMIIDGWEVELHGTLRSQLGKRIDAIIDGVQEDIFRLGNVRVWEEKGVAIYLPSPDNDIIIIFCHILQHFFQGGIGLRQVCDLCRLLWTYRKTINVRLLESRLRKAGLLTEWRAFAELSVVYLGMPVDAMPLYHSTIVSRWRAKRILKRIIKTGNFGHNNDRSHEGKSFWERKIASLWRYTKDALSTFTFFPVNSLRGLRTLVMAGLKRTLGK